MLMVQAWRRFIVGCTAGNVLEWYDFILYGYFSPILSKLFFPTHNEYLSLLLTFGVFASGCIVRPLGSVFFGSLGDRYGRKHALVITIILITFATTAIGCLPTYHHIGLYAPILLTVCRLVQGFAVSGEEVGAAVYLTENAPSRCQGFAGSIILSSVYVGLLCGALSAYAVSTLLLAHWAWAWRIPFIIASVYGVIALVIRLRDLESPLFIKNKEQQKLLSAPVTRVFIRHYLSVIKIILLCAVFAVSIYLFVVYLPSYLSTRTALSLSYTLLLSSASLSVMAVLVLGVGYVVDRVGAKYLFGIGSMGFAIFAYPIFFWLAEGTLVSIALAEIVLCIFSACLAGSVFPLIIHQFPVNVRYTGVALGFNMAMTVFGSTAPMIALTLIHMTHNDLSPFAYLLGAALLSLGVLPFVAEEQYNETTWEVEYGS